MVLSDKITEYLNKVQNKGQFELHHTDGLHLVLLEGNKGIVVNLKTFLDETLGSEWLSDKLKQELNIVDNSLKDVLLTNLDIDAQNSMKIGVAMPEKKWSFLPSGYSWQFQVEKPSILISIAKGENNKYSAKLSAMIVIGEADKSVKLSGTITIGNENQQGDQTKKQDDAPEQKLNNNGLKSDVKLKPLLQYLKLDGTDFDNFTIKTLDIIPQLSDKKLSLTIDIANAWHIYDFELTDVKFHLEISWETGKKDSGTVSHASVDATFTLNDISSQLKATYTDSKWQFTGDITNQTLSLYGGVHDLAHKVDLENVVELLPDAFKDLRIKNIHTTFLPRDKYFDFNLTLQDDDGRWEIIPGLFEVGPAQVELKILEGYLFGEIQGNCYIGKTPFSTTIDFPAFRGETYIPDGQKLSISQVLEQVHLDSTGLQNLSVDALRLLYDSSAKHAILYLELSGSWKDDLVEFNLKNTTIDLDYWGGDGGGLTANLLAEMTLNVDNKDISLLFSAKHPGPNEGWQIAAKAELSKELTIRHIFAKYADTHSDLVDAFLDWSIVDFEITYDTKAKHFVASMKAVWKPDKDSSTTEQDSPEVTQPKVEKADTVLLLTIEKKKGGGKEETDKTTTGESDEAEADAIAEEEAGDKFKGGSISLSGQLLVKGLEFDLIFNTSKKHTSLVGTFSNPAGDGVDIEALITDLIHIDASDFPLESFKIKDAVLAYEKDKQSTSGTKKSKMLFLIDMDAGVDLSGLGHLPLVGSAFSSESRLGIAFTPIYVTQTFSEDDIKALKPNMPASAHPLEGAEVKGFHLAVDVQLGGVTIPANLLSGDQKSLATKADSKPNNGLGSVAESTNDSQPPATKLKWIDIQKHLGPLHLQRLGLGFEKPTLKFAIDASFVLKVLAFRLYGLGGTYDLDSHHLGFALQGMGLDLNKGPAKISADFLNLDGYFVGQASLSMEEFGLSAIGAFTLIDHRPSLFIYAFLDYPLGGPVFFFVEGVAAGFGINRHVTMPEFDKVHEFPLVAEVLKTMPAPSMAGNIGKVGDAKESPVKQDLNTEMTKLHQYISPKLNSFFFAVGLRFSSFEILDTFALLLLSFSTDGDVAIALLGIVRFITPPDPEPEKIAFVELELIAEFNLERGIFEFAGNITDRSFLMDGMAKIAGGFAAIFWFKDDPKTSAEAGDFVVTIGGYYSKFKKPDYYPAVKRLQFSWPMYPSVEAKGTIYFALVPIALMAGGLFELTWSCGLLGAYLKVGADFLIVWKPIHYEAEMFIEIGIWCSIFGLKVSASIGVDLKIWGPEFSGRASFDFKIIKFHVDFGSGKLKPPPLSWEEFKESFLPKPEEDSKKGDGGKTQAVAEEQADEAVEVQPKAGDGEKSKKVGTDKLLSFTVADGLIKQLHDQNNGPPSAWIVNPKHFVLKVATVVPLSAFMLNDQAVARNPELDAGDHLKIEPELGNFGIVPMQVTGPTSTLNIEIRGENNVDVSEEFSFDKGIKNFPAALWGKGGGDDDSNKKRMIKGVGILTLKPSKLPVAGKTSSIERRVLDYELYTKEIADDPLISKCQTFVANREIQQTTINNRGSSLKAQDEKNRKVIQDALVLGEGNPVLAKRDRLLTYLGFNPAQTVDLTDSLEKDFIIAPMVMVKKEESN
ncbi:MAG: hypothetical protein F6K54_20665 [Okeania sp. SIO3B5]|uniref:DUF6603 domain-containing protein n=1 Tax=Okeania sp. SIO3B5 TaxID=2607811 RepID=UPI0013FF209B|nr:DUF6603 domain-containing protein [Okeania sp. SIO3B5]NEO55269.1 hypothetical protein [Okeania sp. SIO3B5]